MPLYREDLDDKPCDVPGCDHTSHNGPMFLHGRCHTGAPTWSQYKDGVVTITCSVCRKPVMSFNVASDPYHGDDEEMRLCKQRLHPCADFLAICRFFGNDKPDGETDDQFSVAIAGEVNEIVRRVMGNRASFGPEDMPLILEAVMRRGGELLGAGEAREVM